MTKIFTMLMAFMLMATHAWAETIECKAGKYTVSIFDQEYASYYIDGELVAGSEVDIGTLVKTPNVLEFALTIDGQPNVIEVIATSVGTKNYAGSFVFKRVSNGAVNSECLNATCTVTK